MIQHNLFPIPVLVSEFYRDFSELELSFVNDVELYPNVGNKTSLDKNVLDSDALKDIRGFVDTQLDLIVKNIICNDNVSLYITQSWLNITKPGEHHHHHYHPNSYFSGVLYFQTSDVLDGIKFSQQKSMFPLSVEPDSKEKYNLVNSTVWDFPIKNKQLILFPSSLHHGVNVVQGNTTRISLSFNTFIKGSVGDINGLTHLKL